MKHVPYKQCFNTPNRGSVPPGLKHVCRVHVSQPGGGGTSVRGIETLFVGYMFQTRGGERLSGVLKHCLYVSQPGGGQRLLGVLKHCTPGYMFHNP